MSPDDLIGGEPRKPTAAQLPVYRALCGATLSLVSANGRARAVFSPLVVTDGGTLIPDWIRRFAPLLELPEQSTAPVPVLALDRALRSGRRALEKGMHIRPFHLITMAAAYHLWVGSASARQAEECLMELTRHLANYAACRLAGVGVLALMGDA